MKMTRLVPCVSPLLLLCSCSYAFVLQQGVETRRMGSRIVPILSRGDGERSRPLLAAPWNSPIDDFASSRVAARLRLDAQRKLEQEIKAREEALRLAEEARRAQEALTRAVRQSEVRQTAAKSMDAAKLAAEEAYRWAEQRVEARMWAEAIKKAQETRRRKIQEARLHAQVESAQKLAAMDRSEWAKFVVETRLKNQARRKLMAREQIVMLTKRAWLTEERRRRALKESAAKQEKAAQRDWAIKRVASRVRLRSEKMAELELQAFEEGLRRAMKSRVVDRARMRARAEAETRALKFERSRWAKYKVEARMQKQRAKKTATIL